MSDAATRIGEKTSLAPDIFTVADIFTPDECAALIEKGEQLGFEAASLSLKSGAVMRQEIRNNDRATWVDEDFAARLWERVRVFLPTEIEGFAAVGLVPRFRFYRYDPGQQFKRHRDGRETTDTGQVSRVTFLIYLNDGYEGGETRFSEYEYSTGQGVKQEIDVRGKTGMGLFFIHERRHEGAEVTKGCKYVIRTDVLYAGAP